MKCYEKSCYENDFHRKAGVLDSSGFKERFLKSSVFDGKPVFQINVDGRPNCGNKAAFSNFPEVGAYFSLIHNIYTHQMGS